MAKDLKTKRRDKSIRKLKSGHLWVPFVTFLLLYVTVGFIIYTAVLVIGEYAVTTKISSEYSAIKYMADIYNETGSSDLLKIPGRPFLLTDGSTNVKESFGENTCSFSGQKINLTFEDENVQVYLDSEKTIFSIDDSGYLNIDWKYFLRTLRDTARNMQDNVEELSPGLEMNFNQVEDIEDKGVNVSVYTNDNYKLISGEMITLYPIWISVPVNEGSLVAKAFFIMNMNDILLVIGLMALFFLAMVIAVIIMLVNLIRSISQQKKSLRVLTTDFVTGGHNWMWFLLKGEKMLRSRSAAKKRYAIVNVMFVDYRNYCVCHSVEAGDEVLVQMHRVLNRNMKKREMCVHTTSSNFALLLNCPDMDSLKERLESFLGMLTEIGRDYNLHFQIGVAPVDIMTDKNGRIVRRKDFDIEAEYNNACAARNSMSNKSESGIALFDDELVNEKRWISTVTENQKKALENEEFVVFYQPKYDPVNNRLKGAEALVRWQSPDFGFVPPGKFIPIFENNGFITEIDHYMLLHVARDQRKWLDEGLMCVPVSVNVSRAHFGESDLAEQIRDIVDSVGTPREYIEIELTESAFFDDKNALINIIQRLQSYGFAVSMDDFGSGYSSLNSLKDMPLDVLKLDAEFFRGANAGERGKIVVSEAIRLAKDLNMRVVAEGIEENEQVRFLADQGCDMIQGFIYAKPLDIEHYVDRMVKNAEKVKAEAMHGSDDAASAGDTVNTDVTVNSGSSSDTDSIEKENESESSESSNNTGDTDDSENTGNT